MRTNRESPCVPVRKSYLRRCGGTYQKILATPLVTGGVESGKACSSFVQNSGFAKNPRL